ncbi:iron-sulfur cluster carrier protein ApbC [Marinomonas mediterranea]|jgi:ATPases involved in chromosome partitioning|uniref:Iron-sulfur cluster carrier protein n=1 Tax=Marinomonas mediterranea (strain ATCC 700492 / JCM 21426 / NBRC 103028 / MMB-1) TaxID=717774 RepID=F2K0P0_MARM1|nr:iron-sulfur cluster carrier protein ApbC [Marinomonas mediterranea]ADZ92132.1 ATPase-like, ParA/MinD [Marinomonas mediterranea MMB-1]WCN18196.1 iron-sulfur cluster carrier protein ApbC [Marinomonas mediterranea MMB-1]
MLTDQEILSALAQLSDENTGVPFGDVWNIETSEHAVSIRLSLSYYADREKDSIKKRVMSVINDGRTVSLEIDNNVVAASVQNNLPGLNGVKNVIAVASGKGGVGKSTTTVNLALAMAKEGAKVGILDADIYGPSQGMMMGFSLETRPGVRDDKFFVPPVAHGIQVMSMAFLTTKETPVAWRGPMVTGALMQILTQTDWEELDYLFIDMPPGTGDIQLTLSQKVPVTGSVIVTTPQDIALLDARRGIEMFRKVNISVLGVVENMSTHICSSCGHQEAIFGEEGGQTLAQEYGVGVLGKLPLSMSIRKQADTGAPTVVSEPESDITEIYQSIARKLGATLATKTETFEMPTIGMSDD